MNPDTSQASGAELARLREENRLLRKQLAGQVRLRQEALHLHHRLDQEMQRFEALQRFMQHSMRVTGTREFGQLACESIIDIFECGAAIVWCLLQPRDNPAAALSVLGIDAPEGSALSELAAWIDRWIEARQHGDATHPPPLPARLGLRDDFLAERVHDDAGRLVAVVIAADPLHAAPARPAFDSCAAKVMLTFARQFGVMITSFLSRATISEQIATIHISEERLHTALRAGNVGLWEWNLATDRVFYSDEWLRQLGLEPGEIGDTPEEWRKRLHPDDLGDALEIVRNCVEHPGDGFEMAVRMRHKDGRWIWIQTRGFHVSEIDGKRRMVGTHFDVTGFKELERKLRLSERKERLARRQAERESLAKSSFLAALSHEIRTPLNGMMAAFQMLESARDGATRDNLVRMGGRAGQWMLKIIGDSLDIARIEAGKMDLFPEIVELPKLLEDLRSVKEGRPAHPEVEFRWLVRGVTPTRVKVDPVRLRQVVANLVGNALKFTQRGHVEVRLDVEPVPRRRKRLRLRIAVSDTGIGFDREFRKILFQPFTQALRKSQSSESGIGLGLVITKELVDLMGGRIQVSSEPGVGSRFEVLVPLEVVAEPATETTEAAAKALPRFKGRILIVEDDPISGELGKLMLEKLGLTVTWARDGAQAVELATREPFDVVIMDCWMPVMDGLEATRRLRHSPEPRLRELPVIALTANVRQADLHACLEAGMNDFMTKPLFFDQLVGKLRPYLRRKATGTLPTHPEPPTESSAPISN